MVRYPDEAASRWFEDGPGHDRPLRQNGPEWRLRQIPLQPDSAYPVRFRKEGSSLPL